MPLDISNAALEYQMQFTQRSAKTDMTQKAFEKAKIEEPAKNRTDVKTRLEHTVCRDVTRFFDAQADLVKGIKEEKGSLAYSDLVNVAGYTYAKLYADIEKSYENSSEHYHRPDGTTVTIYDEIAWLDEEYEAKIAWDKACAEQAALREKFLGNISEIPDREIHGIEDDLYESRKKYMDLYRQDSALLSLRYFHF